MGDFSGANPMRSTATTAQGVPAKGENITVRRGQRKYQKPSVEKAMRYKLALHPSYVPDGGSSHDRRLYPCCIPTGRFCGKRCDCFDLWCEGRISTFTPYGAGVTSFVKFEKWLAWSFALMTLFMLPQLIINSYGDGSTSLASSALSLSSTTLGNLASVNGTGSIVFGFGSSKQTIEKEYIGLVYSLCDLGACVLLGLGFLWLKFFEGKEERQVDKDVTTADDYTVYIPWVPKETTEDDLTELVRRVTSTDMTPSGFQVAEIHVVQNDMDIVSTYVSRGRIFRQIERIADKLARLEDQVRSGHSGCVICCGGIPGQINRLTRLKDLLQKRADKLSDKAKLKSARGGAVAAFITFQQQDAASWVVNEYPDSSAAWCCQSERLRLRNRRIRVVPAPAPSSVLWANLNVTMPSQYIRQTFTGVLTAFLLVGSFVLLWFASWKQQEFQNSGPASHCKDADIVANIDNHSYNATTVGGLDTEDPRLYCWCATQSWTGLSEAKILANPYSSICPAMSCPALFNVSPFDVPNQSFCIAWLRERSITIGLTVGAALAIILINMLLSIFMRVLTVIEGHHSFDDLNASLALRLFFAQFFNTGVLMVIINASAATDLIPIKFKTGKYDDFSVGWYQNVGGSLMTTMLINIITPHVYSFSSAVRYWCRLRNKKLADKAPSQRDLNEVFIGPYMDYSLRYASLYNTLFVCFVFSTGMPLMLPIAAVAFMLAYWIDKILFMWYFRRPPSFSMALQRVMSSLIPVALVCHLAVGTWMISNVTVFKGMLDPLGVQRYAGLAEALFDSYVDQSAVEKGAKRVTEIQALPLLVLLALMVAVMVLRFLFEGFRRLGRGLFNFMTCGYCSKVAFDWDKDELVYTPSYTEALDPRNAGSKLAMHGIPSYNMLMNPEIQAAFAITPEFARTHKTLGEVALYRIGQSSRRFKGTGGSKGRMARNSSGHDRDSSQPQSWSPPISPGSAGSYNGGLSPMSAGGGSVGSGHGSVNGGIGGGGGDPNGIMTSPTGANSVVGFAGVTAGPIVDGVAVPVIPLQGSGFMMPQGGTYDAGIDAMDVEDLNQSEWVEDENAAGEDGGAMNTAANAGLDAGDVQVVAGASYHSGSSGGQHGDPTGIAGAANTDDELDEEELQALADNEVGGCLAGYPPAITASRRRLSIQHAPPPLSPKSAMSMRNLLASGAVQPPRRPSAVVAEMAAAAAQANAMMAAGHMGPGQVGMMHHPAPPPPPTPQQQQQQQQQGYGLAMPMHLSQGLPAAGGVYHAPPTPYGGQQQQQMAGQPVMMPMVPVQGGITTMVTPRGSQATYSALPTVAAQYGYPPPPPPPQVALGSAYGAGAMASPTRRGISGHAVQPPTTPHTTSFVVSVPAGVTGVTVVAADPAAAMTSAGTPRTYSGV